MTTEQIWICVGLLGQALPWMFFIPLAIALTLNTKNLSDEHLFLTLLVIVPIIMLCKDLKDLPKELNVEIIDSMPGGANVATTVIRLDKTI